MSNPGIKRIFIIKRYDYGSTSVTGGGNKVYETIEEAEKRAAELARSERAQFIIFSAVSGFAPRSEVQRINVIDLDEERRDPPEDYAGTAY